MTISQIKSYITSGKLDEKFRTLYGGGEEIARARYLQALDSFVELYGDGEASLYSVSGRTEISGNHTDHNRGCVIAASISLDIIAVARPTDDGVIRIKSEGFDEDVVDISAYTTPDEKKFFTSESIIAGMCTGFTDRGFKHGGFCAYTTSNVFKGSGLSSSAAFEVMVGNILNHLYNGGEIDNFTIAKISQFAENVFFGKPSGLMDQTACAVGGIVAIDFESPEDAKITAMNYDFGAAGYDLCIIGTGGNHADLNDDYASIPAEMKAVAAHFGKKELRGITMEELMAAVPVLRETCGDRAILRASHFINENKRVQEQTAALQSGDIARFLQLVRESGESSYMYLQNVFTTKNVSEQGLSLALCLTSVLCAGTGAAWRVHGGGFAGTIQVFVPKAVTPAFKAGIEAAFGEGNCHILAIRPEGAMKLL